MSSGRRAVVALVLSIVLGAGLVSAAPGCGGGEEPAPTGKGGKKSSAALDPASKARRKELEEKVSVIAKALSNAPLDVDRTTSDCEKYERECADAGLSDLAKKCGDMRKEAKEVYEKAAEKETREACEGARKYALEGDTKKARNRLAGLHRNIQKDDRYWSKALLALHDVELAERADRYFERVTKAKLDMFKRYEEWERAQGLLEAFLAIPAFKASPRAKDVETALGEVKPQAEKVRAVRATEQKIRWIPAFNGSNDDLFKWELGDHQACTVAEKVLSFKHNVPDQDWLSMMYGQDEWEDYIVEINFRLEKGPFYINIRGSMQGEGDDKTRNWQEGVKIAADEYKDKDRWYKVRLEARGGELRWTPPGASAPTTKKLKYPKGPFEIRLPKGGVIQIKTVWVKVLKPAGGTPEK